MESIQGRNFFVRKDDLDSFFTCVEQKSQEKVHVLVHVGQESGKGEVDLHFGTFNFKEEPVQAA